ncbi:MAG: LPP20 family lipoprotein [Myxococcota bacterium]
MKRSKPAWVDGEDSRFPYDAWLCGVGFSTERAAAENAAYAALSRIFVARVASVSKDFMGAYASTGADPLEVQSVEQLTKVSTGKVFSDVRIIEVWQSKAGETFALACLERSKAARVLQNQINAADEHTAKLLDKASRSDKAAKVASLSKALEAMAEREALNGELRIVNANGIGVASQYSHVDVVEAFEAAVDALKIAVHATGPYDGDFRSVLIGALTKRGYKVTEGSADGMDVLVTATIRMEDGGKGTGRQASYDFARGVIHVEVKNVAQNKILDSMTESRKEGHRNLAEAERRAVRALAKTISTKVGAKVEQAMLR